jgi:hypothetical protein
VSERDRFADLFEKLPTAFMASVLRDVKEFGLLDEVREWLDDETYDPARSGGRGRFSEHLLLACDEAIEFSSDPGEVLTCLATADQLAFTGATSNVSVGERVEALRPPKTDVEENETWM